MVINPHTEESFKGVQVEEMERVRGLVRKLSPSSRELFEQGEEIIEACIERQSDKNQFDFNVFNLKNNVNGEVMKLLAMLCAAAGFHHVSISCECYTPMDSSYHVTYPNAISFKARR